MAKRRDVISNKKRLGMANTSRYKREPLLGVVVGKKGIGKTHQTLMMIKNYVLGLMGQKPRRVLIFDVNNEFGQFKSISLSEVKEWSDKGKVNVKRIQIFKSVKDADLKVNGKPVFYSPTGKMTLNEMAQALFYILEHFHNGLLLIEDINKYVSDSLPNDLIGSIVTQRHRGVDVIMHFQTIGKFGHPKIVGNANWLRFHKVTDKVERHDKKFTDLTEPLMIVEKLVDRKYKEAVQMKRQGKFTSKIAFKKASSFYAYWDNDEEKIKGQFNKVDFVYAVVDFLQANYNKVVRPAMNEVSLTSGEKRHADRKTVIAELIRGYIYEYYGN